MPRRKNLSPIVCLALLASLIGYPAHSAELNQVAPNADQPQFTSVIEDLPLMPGLSTVEDKDVLFVTPKSGRIAETEATGEVDIDSVYDFYRASLPHLGWKKVDGRTYLRENEILRIDAHADGKVTTVRFSVKPNNR